MFTCSCSAPPSTATSHQHLYMNTRARIQGKFVIYTFTNKVYLPMARSAQPRDQRRRAARIPRLRGAEHHRRLGGGTRYPRHCPGRRAPRVDRVDSAHGAGAGPRRADELEQNEVSQPHVIYAVGSSLRSRTRRCSAHSMFHELGDSLGCAGHGEHASHLNIARVRTDLVPGTRFAAAQRVHSTCGSHTRCVVHGYAHCCAGAVLACAACSRVEGVRCAPRRAYLTRPSIRPAARRRPLWTSKENR